MAELSDGEIIAAVRAGQREQFAAIAKRYQPGMLQAAFSRLGRWEWAEEAVQESFLAALKSLHTYDSRYSFRTWLWTITLNQCHRHYQRRSRQDRAVDRGGDLTQQPAPEHDSPEARAIARERRETLRELLQQLPDTQADALRLRFFGGLKFHEIAAAMNCSLTSAKNRVRWGLAKMSGMIETAADREEAGRDPPPVPPWAGPAT
jgi:RNA polymerase sigma-70 factor (ECF subfamily)